MIPDPTAILALTLVQKAEAHTLFTIPLGGYELHVTQHMFMALMSCILVLLVFLPISRRIAVKGASVEDHVTRGRVSQLFESILVFLRENVARPNLGHLTDKYIYYIWTVFFVVLFANLLGLAPVGQTVALAAYLLGHENHYEYWQFWGGPAMSNINMTAALATFSFIAIVFIGLKENGVEFLKHFAPVPFKPWPMIPLALFLIFLEIIGLIIKSCVLALRLFGNILAGFLVVLALVGLIYQFGKGGEAPVMGYSVGVGVTLGTVAILFLELFVAFLQTFIFTFLTVLFISQGAVHHGEHEDHDDHAHEDHPGIAKSLTHPVTSQA